MRWSHPQINDVRKRIKFAWLPTQVDDVDTDKSFTVWLENYIRIDRYDEWYDGEHSYDCWGTVKREVMPLIMKKV